MQKSSLGGSDHLKSESLVCPVPSALPGVGWWHAGIWITLYLLAIAFPLLLLMVGSLPKGGGFAWDFSMALGFAGLAMLGLQFILTARFRRLAAPFGIDIIYFFHRWAAIGAVSLLVVHYAIIRFAYADVLGDANPVEAPWHMTAGRLALLIFVIIIASSLWRQQFRIEYDRWRLWHGILAVVGVALAIFHIQGVGYYTASAPRQLFWQGYTIVWLLILVYIRIVKPWTLLRKPYGVTNIKQERGNSWTVTLSPLGEHSMKFAPGQFAWLTLGSSPFRAKEHPFSFSSSAEKPRELQFTIKELGDFTRTIKNFKPGDVAFVDAPYGVFSPDRWRSAPGFGLIAGGVGIAPIMSMLRTFADRGEKRPILLIYGNSDWERVLLREDLEAIQPQLNLKIVHVLHKPPADWAGETGIITHEILQKHIVPAACNFTFFVCGPPGMISAVQKSLRNLGVPLSRIHFEHFEMV